VTEQTHESSHECQLYSTPRFTAIKCPTTKHIGHKHVGQKHAGQKHAGQKHVVHMHIGRKHVLVSYTLCFGTTLHALARMLFATDKYRFLGNAFANHFLSNARLQRQLKKIPHLGIERWNYVLFAGLFFVPRKQQADRFLAFRKCTSRKPVLEDTFHFQLL
jgi:hypothetical protein